MTMSTFLRTEAVGRLMDIHELCNRVLTGDAKDSMAEDLARDIITVIKAP